MGTMASLVQHERPAFSIRTIAFWRLWPWYTRTTMNFDHEVSLDLSIIVPIRHEKENLKPLLTNLESVLNRLGMTREIILVDGKSTDGTAEEGRRLGAQVHEQEDDGYGAALRTGFRNARGRWIITMDGDMSHDPAFINSLWQSRERAEVIVCSRYAPFGYAEQGTFRLVLSWLLNMVFRRALSLPIADLSSSYRMYRRSILEEVDPIGKDFNSLIEILVRIYCLGYTIHEIPFHYHPRLEGISKVRLFHFAVSYLITLGRLWKLRNSVETADYDARAFNSIVWPQRYWQRKRYHLVRSMLDPGGRILDIGCGSSFILVSLPGSFGVDLAHRKLRCLRGTGPHLATAALKDLPFPDDTFDQVICSQVIEHIPEEDISFDEMVRVLRPGGKLVLGTPDYGRIWWPMIEWVYKRVMPGGYADEHITHFTRVSMCREMEARGVKVDRVEYICGGEMIACGYYDPNRESSTA